MSIVLTHNQGRFICRVKFEDRDIPKKAKFFWCPLRKHWYTENTANAVKLRQFADEHAEKEISRIVPKAEPFVGSVPYPSHLKPYPFQIERAVPWALSRPRTYLALDPGLGKTICAALWITALNAQAIYICPPFLMANVEVELKRWIPGCTVARITDANHQAARVVLVPDSLLIRPLVLKKIQASAMKGRVLIVDEAHRYKSQTAKRTKTLFRFIAPLCHHHLYLSGTPMPNRPIELYPVLAAAAPDTIGFRNYWQYGEYYCGGFQNAYGWDFSGASNLAELTANIKKDFMLRIKKDEVLPELPPKTESLVFIDEDLPLKFSNLEKRILTEHTPETLSDVTGDDHLSTYRKDLGLLKAKAAAKFVRDILEDSGESVLLFAIHKEAIAAMAESLKDFEPLIITGSVDKDERFRRATEFQNNPQKRLMILNVQAGGVGFNLTKATRVIFAESPWVPGEIDQASDRAHRIGQKDNVYVQFLVFRESLDALVLQVVLRKRQITNHI